LIGAKLRGSLREGMTSLGRSLRQANPGDQQEGVDGKGYEEDDRRVSRSPDHGPGEQVA
jgi:hypothetical protein